MGLVSGLLKIGTKIATRIKYGKQVGKLSISNYGLYAKKSKGKSIYTVFNHNINRVEQQKTVFNPSKDYRYSVLKDHKGNVIQTTEKTTLQNGFGFSSNNKFTPKQRVINTKYNKFGQAIDRRDITMTPAIDKPKVTILRNENGKMSETFWNTQTGAKHTITCSE